MALKMTMFPMFKDPITPAEQLYAGIQITRPLLRVITERVERDLTGSGISVGQRAILEALLAVGKATAPQLTEMLDVTRQFVGREVKDLLAAGHLETEANPKHRTSVYYLLTAESRQKIESIRASETKTIQAFLMTFTDAEVDAYYRIQKALLTGLAQN